MKLRRKSALIVAMVVVAVLVGTALLLHSPALQDQIRHLHGDPSRPGGRLGTSGIGGSAGDPDANARPLEGVAASRAWQRRTYLWSPR